MDNFVSLVSNHLEFVGYSVEPVNFVNGTQGYFAFSSSEYNIIFYKLYEEFWNFSIRLRTKNIMSDKSLNLINTINRNLSLSKIFYLPKLDEEETTLCIDCVYIGKYEKYLFSNFLNLLKKDIDLFHSLNEQNNFVI